MSETDAVWWAAAVLALGQFWTHLTVALVAFEALGGDPLFSVEWMALFPGAAAVFLAGAVLPRYIRRVLAAIKSG
jgi:hypothetical protein